MNAPEPRYTGADKWHFVDVRMNPDGKYYLLFQPREAAVPTPLWVDEKGEKCPNFAVHYKYPIPFIARHAIEDKETALKHARIFDMYFGSRERMEEPDYEDLMEYLKSIAPQAWRDLTEIAAGRKKNPDTTALQQSLKKAEKREELKLESEAANKEEKPVKKKNPTKKTKNVGKEKPKKKFTPKRSQMSIF